MTAVIVPILLMIFVYYGFSTNYTRWVFGEASFKGQYERGIYRYRIIGREGLLFTFRLLRDQKLDAPREKPVIFTEEQVHHFDQVGDLTFYNAYFVWNTLGAVLTSVLLALMLKDRSLFSLTQPEASLWVLLTSFVIAITQYVMTPYDTIAYALLVGCAWASLRAIRRPHLVTGALAVGLLVLGVLNRETALLNVALAGAASMAWFGLGRRTIITALLAGLAFGATYVGLRVALGTEHAVYDFFSLFGWAREAFSRVGALALACVLAVPLLVPSAPLRLYGWFLLFSTPYLFVTLGAGVTWEVRLWTPLFITAVLCAGLSGERVRQGA
jgi:hypothetical protein